MSEENVETVRRMYEAFHSADAESALAYFDPAVVADHSRRLGGGIGHSREDLRSIITEWVGTFEEFREEIEEIRDLGRYVYVIVTQRGRGKGSGVEVENRYALLYEVQGGRITWMATYPNSAEALEAAGLSE